MPADRKDYTTQRRTGIKVIRGRNIEEIFNHYFPDIDNKYRTTKLIDTQMKYLKRKPFKKISSKYIY